MKNFIYCLTILSVLCFCGCGQTQEGVKESAQKNVEDTKDTHEGTERGKEVVETTPVPGRIENAETEEVLKEELPIPAYMRDVEDEVYRDLITKIVEEDVFPVSNYETDGPVYDQSYAILDIDGDGKEELIINYSGASSMAGMVYYVYDYNRTTGDVYIECAGWPDVDFLDNGYVKEEASHNHGRSCLDDFWPYHLLKYNPEKDVYESIAHVDAWQKELYPEGFPVDADKDGDGIVYYTAPASYIPTEFMDKAEYDTWCEQYNKGTVKEIQWKKIISEEDYRSIYKSDEEKRTNDAADITLQIELICEEKDLWMQGMEYANDVERYTVTDLDGNGRLELIASNCGGTGHYTYSRFYEVNETYDGLVLCSTNFTEDSSQPDIMDNGGVITVYEDEQGVRHYLFKDMIHDVSDYYYTSVALSLLEGKVITTPLAVNLVRYHAEEEYPSYIFMNGQNEEISQENYIRIIDDTFKSGCQKYVVNWTWLDKQVIKDAEQSELNKMLQNAYEATVWNSQDKLPHYGKWLVEECVGSVQDDFGNDENAAMYLQKELSYEKNMFRYEQSYTSLSDSGYGFCNYTKERFSEEFGISRLTIELPEELLWYNVLVDGNHFGQSFTVLNNDTMLLYYEGYFFRARRIASSVTEVKEELSTLAYMTDITDQVYRNLITEMLVTGKFPVSGSESDLPHFYSYAVLDIDGDEREELLIVFSSTTHTPSWVLYIYDYDRVTGAAYIEYWDSPDASFYGNGYVKKAEWNNHGRSDLDDFWPYHLLIYNSEKDIYESITHVDAWQKELYEDGFPEDADKDGDGIVYYTSDIQFETPLSFMDKAEYEIWCEQYNKGTAKTIQWKEIMTLEDYVAIYLKYAVG